MKHDFRLFCSKHFLAYSWIWAIAGGLFAAAATASSAQPVLLSPSGIVHLEVRPAAVQLGKEAAIRLFLPENKPKETRFEWTATEGSVIEKDHHYYFQPPDHPCRAFLRLSILTGGGEWARGTTAALCYRQLIILKADDVATTPPDFYKRWSRYFDYITTTPGLKGSAGVVGYRMQHPDPSIVLDVRRWNESGNMEFFSHGWDHGHGKKTAKTGNDWSQASSSETSFEFKGPPYETQLEHLRNTQNLMRETYGVYMRTFGAPFNKVDRNTKAALRTLRDLDVWLEGLGKGRLVIARGGGEIELSPGNPDYSTFQRTWDQNRPMLMLQIHPGSYASPSAWKTFKQCIQALQDYGVTFIHPREYADLTLSDLIPEDNQAPFPDIGLECAIRQQGDCWDKELDKTKLATITSLVYEKPLLKILDLRGLEQCPALKEARLQGNLITSLSPLALLPPGHPLAWIDLRDNPLPDEVRTAQIKWLEATNAPTAGGDTTKGSLPLTLRISGQGAVTPPPGEYRTPRGRMVLVDVVPASGWRVESWQGLTDTPCDSRRMAIRMTAARTVEIRLTNRPVETVESPILQEETPPTTLETPSRAVVPIVIGAITAAGILVLVFLVGWWIFTGPKTRRSRTKKRHEKP